MAGSAAAANVVEEKLSHLQLQQENENLKSQVNYINKISFIFFLNITGKLFIVKVYKI